MGSIAALYLAVIYTYLCMHYLYEHLLQKYITQYKLPFSWIPGIQVAYLRLLRLFTFKFTLNGCRYRSYILLLAILLSIFHNLLFYSNELNYLFTINSPVLKLKILPITQ